MQFRIADTFTDSLTKLTGDEQKIVKTTAFDLQLNPANPGMQFHRLNGARDPNFWSVRVSRDIRLIVHRTADSLLLCYVDHHDKAYQWAERRKLQVHPTTGAAQLVGADGLANRGRGAVGLETAQGERSEFHLAADDVCERASRVADATNGQAVSWQADAGEKPQGTAGRHSPAALEVSPRR